MIESNTCSTCKKCTTEKLSILEREVREDRGARGEGREHLREKEEDNEGKGSLALSTGHLTKN